MFTFFSWRCVLLLGSSNPTANRPSVFLSCAFVVRISMSAKASAGMRSLSETFGLVMIWYWYFCSCPSPIKLLKDSTDPRESIPITSSILFLIWLPRNWAWSPNSVINICIIIPKSWSCSRRMLCCSVTSIPISLFSETEATIDPIKASLSSVVWMLPTSSWY